MIVRVCSIFLSWFLVVKKKRYTMVVLLTVPVLAYQQINVFVWFGDEVVWWLNAFSWFLFNSSDLTGPA